MSGTINAFVAGMALRGRRVLFLARDWPFGLARPSSANAEAPDRLGLSVGDAHWPTVRNGGNYLERVRLTGVFGTNTSRNYAASSGQSHTCSQDGQKHIISP